MTKGLLNRINQSWNKVEIISLSNVTFWSCNQPSFKAGKELKMFFLIILIPLLVLNLFPHVDFCRSHSSSPEAKSFTSFWGSSAPWCQRPTTPPSGAGRAASKLCSDPLSQPSLELSTESKSSLPLIRSSLIPATKGLVGAHKLWQSVVVSFGSFYNIQPPLPDSLTPEPPGPAQSFFLSFFLSANVQNPSLVSQHSKAPGRKHKSVSLYIRPGFTVSIMHPVKNSCALILDFFTSLSPFLANTYSLCKGDNAALVIVLDYWPVTLKNS